MKAMILAAGRGERMRPLTDVTPKPLLTVGGKALIEYHLEKLQAIGVEDVVINHYWLGNVIEETLGDGSRYGLRIHYSPEEETDRLFAGGGIRHALPMLEDDRFLVINGDVYTDFDFHRVLDVDLASNKGCLFLCNTPEYYETGDFGVGEDGFLTDRPDHTFSGIALYDPEAFREVPDHREPLSPYWKKWREAHQLLAFHFDDFWCDVGTPERLRDLDARLNADKGPDPNRI